MKKYFPFLLFFLNFIVLFYTAYPSIGWWDSGEYAYLSYNLGIPSPSGSIFFILLARLSAIVLFFIKPITAITLVSVLSTTLASVFFYFTLLLILNNISKKSDEMINSIVSFLTALSIPFPYSIWQEAITTRVYASGLLLTGIILFCALFIWLTEDEDKKMKMFFVLLLSMGLDFSAHRLNSPFIPVEIILLLFPLRNSLLNYKFWIASILIFFTGLSINLYLIIRSHNYTPFDSDSTRTLSQLISWIKRERYGGESNILRLFDRRASLWDYQINFMYLRYLWQNFLSLNNSGSYFQFLTGLPLFLGVIGFMFCLIKKVKIWILIFIMYLMFSFLLIVYLNVSEGFHTIRQIDRLFIPSFYIFSIWVGLGLYFIYTIIHALADKIFDRKILAVIIITIVCFLILPCNFLISNWSQCNKNKFYFPVDFAYNLLSSCEKNAVLFTNGDNDSFPLWYLQYVEKYRTDVCVMNVNLMNLQSYGERMMKEPFSFPVDTSIIQEETFKPSAVEKPEEVIILPSDSDTVYADTLKFTYCGRKMGGKTVSIGQDKILLSFLKVNKWKRPVYFSSTVSSYNLIGLQNYLSSVGVANKLVTVKGKKILLDELENNLLNVYNFRYFNDPSVKMDLATPPLMRNFREAFLQLVQYYVDNNNKVKARELYKIMNDKLPPWRFSEAENKILKNFEKKLYN